VRLVVVQSSNLFLVLEAHAFGFSASFVCSGRAPIYGVRVSATPDFAERTDAAAWKVFTTGLHCTLEKPHAGVGFLPFNSLLRRRGDAISLNGLAILIYSRARYESCGMAIRARLSFEISAMKTLCVCGFDCTEFVAHHEIPSAAQFSCPNCETPLHVGAEPTAMSTDTVPGASRVVPERSTSVPD
jgi:hypothetical protein